MHLLERPIQSTAAKTESSPSVVPRHIARTLTSSRTPLGNLAGRRVTPPMQYSFVKISSGRMLFCAYPKTHFEFLVASVIKSFCVPEKTSSEELLTSGSGSPFENLLITLTKFLENISARSLFGIL